MFNKCIFMGRLTRNPELKELESGHKVCKFSIAVNRTGKQDGADFFNLVAWDKTAEFISKYFTKGRVILCETHAQQRKFTGKDGKEVSITEYMVESAQFGDSKPSTTAEPAMTFDDNATDDELPW